MGSAAENKNASKEAANDGTSSGQGGYQNAAPNSGSRGASGKERNKQGIGQSRSHSNNPAGQNGKEVKRRALISCGLRLWGAS
jgi:hypothetical protein